MTSPAFSHIAVYLGSSGRGRTLYTQHTRDLGRAIAKAGRHLIYGGMNAGLMGVLAYEALHNAGAVTGVIPTKIRDSERVMEGLTDTVFVPELSDRKRVMFEKADAVIVLPGGFGTLDEALEVLYWRSLGLHNKPVVFVNVDGYWDDALAFITALPDYLAGFSIHVDSAKDAIPALDELPQPANTTTSMTLPHCEDSISKDPNTPIIIDHASLQSAYFATCALGLKQLGKHNRPIGFLNTNEQFSPLLRWIQNAQKETFITDKCLNLFDSAPSHASLNTKLSQQAPPSIDLHTDKWGDSIHDL